MERNEQKIKFLALAIALMLSTAIFIVGAYWVKSIFDRIDQLRIVDAGSDIKQDLEVEKDRLKKDLSYIDSVAALKSQNTKPNAQAFSNLKASELSNPDLDFVAVFSERRAVRSIAMSNEAGQALESKPSAVFEAVLTMDSKFFNDTQGGKIEAGFITLNGKPMMISMVNAIENKQSLGYLAIGRWVSLQYLASSRKLPVESLRLVALNGSTHSNITPDMDQAKNEMKGDSSFYGRLERRGGGVGYLRIDDVEERPSFILRFPWIELAATGERQALGWLFLASLVFGGVIHLSSTFAIARLGDERRRNPGFGGLSHSEYRESVESFPGYAFALDNLNHYIAVSRGLAGLMGKEPSELVGLKFGLSCKEAEFDPDAVRAELVSGKQWPAIFQASMTISGLSETTRLSCISHWVTAKESLFIVATKEIESAAENLSNITPISQHDAYQDQHHAPLRNAQ